MPESPQPFTVEVGDDALADLRERLRRTRFPDQPAGVGWSYGTELGYLRELVATWRDGYDWRAQEERLNRLGHFTVELDGRRLHFLHRRSPEPGARPLLLLHGWPGSVYEFHKVVGPLADPVAHGGRAEDAFHVVCPSLPGFAWSEAPREPGLSLRDIAGLYRRLMALLGYDGYLVQGGDLGSYVATHLAREDPACRGLHLNLVVVGPPEGIEDPTADLTREELEDLGQLERFQREESGYFHLQITKPQTLGYALADSPAGLAAWIVEKFHTGTDGDLETKISRDELLTNVSIYWFTGSMPSAVRLYREAHLAGEFAPTRGRLEVPTACLIAPQELSKPPRRWVEAVYRVERWTRLERGGHFLALEEPEAFVHDLREFARGLDSAQTLSPSPQ